MSLRVLCLHGVGHLSCRTSQVLYPVWLSKQAVGVCKGLLIKDPEARLGSGSTGEADLKAHPFFESIE